MHVPEVRAARDPAWLAPSAARFQHPGLLLCLTCPAGLQVDYQTFSELYADIFTPIEPLIAQQQLRAAAGWPTYLLSNCR